MKTKVGEWIVILLGGFFQILRVFFQLMRVFPLGKRVSPHIKPNSLAATIKALSFFSSAMSKSSRNLFFRRSTEAKDK